MYSLTFFHWPEHNSSPCDIMQGPPNASSLYIARPHSDYGALRYCITDQTQPRSHWRSLYVYLIITGGSNTLGHLLLSSGSLLDFLHFSLLCTFAHIPAWTIITGFVSSFQIVPGPFQDVPRAHSGVSKKPVVDLSEVPYVLWSWTSLTVVQHWHSLYLPSPFQINPKYRLLIPPHSNSSQWSLRIFQPSSRCAEAQTANS